MSPSDKKSPDLEVISNQNELSFKERRAVPRLLVGSEQVKITQFKKIFSVLDLSLGGFGFLLLDRTDQELFSVGLALQGWLNLRREKYPVHFRVQNLSRDRVGCRFEDLSTSLTQALSRVLDPAYLGSQ